MRASTASPIRCVRLAQLPLKPGTEHALGEAEVDGYAPARRGAAHEHRAALAGPEDLRCVHREDLSVARCPDPRAARLATAERGTRAYRHQRHLRGSRDPFRAPQAIGRAPAFRSMQIAPTQLPLKHLLQLYRRSSFRSRADIEETDGSHPASAHALEVAEGEAQHRHSAAHVERQSAAVRPGGPLADWYDAALR